MRRAKCVGGIRWFANHAGSAIADDVSTVNGSIHLTRTEVGGSLITVNGSVELTDHSRVAGDVIIKGKNRRGARKKAIEITIADGSVVEGDVIVRDSKRQVTVILSGGGRVEGEIRNAKVVEE